MHRTLNRWLALALFLPTLALAEPDFRAVYSTQGSFEDVKQGVELAITGRGLVISHYSNIGEMLARTGEDVGSDRQVYLQAGVVEFCSAVMSRRMMEADPGNIIFCPYAIALYVLPDAPDTVHLSYERLAKVAGGSTTEVLAEIEELLDGIVQEAMAF